MRHILIDCSHVCYAAYYSMPKLKTNEIETGVLYGFLKRVLSISNDLNSNKLIFCWDSSRSLRKEKYSWYKERRSKNRDQAMVDMINEQKNVLMTVILPTIGFTNQILIDGYEADDVMAYLVKSNPEDSFVIVANDEDLYQILRHKNLKGIYRLKDRKVYTRKDFKKEYLGIKAGKWALVKAIAGCGTDEVPGVAGVGDMTAVKYLTGNLLDRYKAYQAIKSEEGKKIIARNKWLVTLPLQGIEEIKIDILPNKFSHDGFLKICKMYKFLSLYNNRFTWFRMMKGWI